MGFQLVPEPFFDLGDSPWRALADLVIGGLQDARKCVMVRGFLSHVRLS